MKQQWMPWHVYFALLINTISYALHAPISKEPRSFFAYWASLHSSQSISPLKDIRGKNPHFILVYATINWNRSANTKGRPAGRTFNYTAKAFYSSLFVAVCDEALKLFNFTTPKRPRKWRLCSSRFNSWKRFWISLFWLSCVTSDREGRCRQ